MPGLAFIEHKLVEFLLTEIANLIECVTTAI